MRLPSLLKIDRISVGRVPTAPSQCEAFVKRFKSHIDGGERLIQLFQIDRRVFIGGMAAKAQADVFYRFGRCAKNDNPGFFQLLNLKL